MTPAPTLLLLPGRPLLHRRPLHHRRPEHRHRARHNRNDKHLDQRIIIRLQRATPVRRGDHALKRRRAGARDARRVDAGDAREIRRQAIVEHGLGDGDEDGAAEILAEQHQGHAHGDVAAGEDDLGGEGGLLEAEADAEAEQDLRADPERVRGGRGEELEEGGAGGGEGRREQHEGRVVAELADDDARGDGGDDER